MSLIRLWSGKASGIPAFLVESFRSLLHQLADRFASLVWKGNLRVCGAHTRILWWPTIRYPGRIHIGSDSVLARGVELSAEFDSGGLHIGDRTWVGEKSKIDFTGEVRIGSDCTLSPGVTIYSHSHGRDPRSKPQGLPLNIGDRVWIGTDAVILQNVSVIPDDCIIGARAIVTRNPLPGEILGGNPAKVIARQDPA